MQVNHDSDLRFWSKLVQRALLRQVRTPFYLLSAAPIRGALRELAVLERALVPKARTAPDASRRREAVRVRHWLSCKTQPVPALLRWWRRQGGDIEVVSEYELRAALKEGYAPEQILVNGPAKHHWLPHLPLRRLRVNFDSPRELAALLPRAKALDWSVGVRCLTQQEYDPEDPARATQFGLRPDEAVRALRQLQRSGARLETVHFHLRTNVGSTGTYERAVDEVAGICHAAAFQPKHLDCGGGIPPAKVRNREGKLVDAAFGLVELGRVYARAVRRFPGLKELWFENGRFVTARSGVLVIKVLDLKERRGRRHLICDGGRTNQALISNWEIHRIFALNGTRGRRLRRGPAVETSVHGPTCMAFDQLARCRLPHSIRPGDYLVWMDAGAYLIPWETRFSHGHATVLWHSNERLTVARPRESFASWWGQWR